MCIRIRRVLQPFRRTATEPSRGRRSLVTCTLTAYFPPNICTIICVLSMLTFIQEENTCNRTRTKIYVFNHLAGHLLSHLGLPLRYQNRPKPHPLMLLQFPVYLSNSSAFAYHLMCYQSLFQHFLEFFVLRIYKCDRCELVSVLDAIFFR